MAKQGEPGGDGNEDTGKMPVPHGQWENRPSLYPIEKRSEKRALKMADFEKKSKIFFPAAA